MRVQNYDVTVTYERGKNMLIADMLLRAYLTDAVKSQKEFEQVNMAGFLPLTDQRLEEIRNETTKDKALQVLSAVILQGWPESRGQVPTQAVPYFSVRDELTVQDGVVFRGERVLIPCSLRPSIKARIHASHMGVESCLRRARECVFWPGMSGEVKQLIEACETCRKYQISQPRESLMPHEVPTRPWQKVGVDLFEMHKKEYLVCVDYYSNFFEVDPMTSTTASAVIKKLKNHFARYGCPDTVVADNGPQFLSKEFAQETMMRKQVVMIVTMKILKIILPLMVTLIKVYNI